jgi:hypothetical protein
MPALSRLLFPLSVIPDLNAFYPQLLLVLLAGAGIGFWWSSLRARELAVQTAKQRCQREKVQFLDQTVALSQIKPVRLNSGSLGWQRHYRFEFTDDGAHRDRAHVTLQGNRVTVVRFPFTRDEDGVRVYTH